jgi:hypothetical protein
MDSEIGVRGKRNAEITSPAPKGAMKMGVGNYAALLDHTIGEHVRHQEAIVMAIARQLRDSNMPMNLIGPCLHHLIDDDPTVRKLLDSSDISDGGSLRPFLAGFDDVDPADPVNTARRIAAETAELWSQN